MPRSPVTMPPAAFAISAVLFAFQRTGRPRLFRLLIYARVYVGDHYPGDVLAGIIIGLASVHLDEARIRSLAQPPMG